MRLTIPKSRLASGPALAAALDGQVAAVEAATVRPLTADGCLPCEAAQNAALAVEDEAPDTEDDPGPEGDGPDDTADGTTIGWSGPICFEGTPTGDGRIMESGSLWWENLPIPFRWDEEDDGMHSGAVVTGLVETITRRDNGEIYGTGIIDLVSDNGWKCAGLMARGILKGVSVDLDSVEFEISVKAELLDMDDEPLEVGADGRIIVYEGASDDELMALRSARIRALTAVDVPAFADAVIKLDGPLPASQPTGSGSVALAASGVVVDMRALTAAAPPAAPPGEWFRDPKLPGLTPFTVTAKGRIYGHIAPWGACHVGYAGECKEAPRSASGYTWFHTGAVLTAEGDEIPVGRISANTGHPSHAHSAAATVAHYDNTGTCVAEVRAGEDAYGIWVAGSLRPGVTAAQVRALRAGPPSGDWRMVGGALELCHVLAVNMPGFPVPRPQGFVASGRTVSLQLPGVRAADRAPAADGLTAEERSRLREILAADRVKQDALTASAADAECVAAVEALEAEMAAADLASAMTKAN